MPKPTDFLPIFDYVCTRSVRFFGGLRGVPRACPRGRPTARGRPRRPRPSRKKSDGSCTNIIKNDPKIGRLRHRYMGLWVDMFVPKPERARLYLCRTRPILQKKHPEKLAWLASAMQLPQLLHTPLFSSKSGLRETTWCTDIFPRCKNVLHSVYKHIVVL